MEDSEIIRGRRLTNAESWALWFPDNPYIGDKEFEKLFDKILALYTIDEDFYE